MLWPAMPETLRLLIALRMQYAFDREAFRGVARAAETYGNIFLYRKDDDDAIGHAAREIKAHGLVVSASEPREVERVAAVGLPCVNVANYLAGHARVPVVGTDDRAIGELVAADFLERGFEHFAFFAEPPHPYFYPRRHAFVAAVRRAGFTCHAWPPPPPEPGAGGGADHAGAGGARGADIVREERAAPWLAGLPKPLAVMCPFDSYAVMVVRACKIAGLRVPEEVSVVGVDDDPLLCMTAWPQVSSVASAGFKVGQAALEVVRAIAEGEPAPPEPLLFPPTGLVVRGSSSEVAIADADVAAAVNFIRTHVRRRLTVEDLVDVAAVSRRTLERKFLDALGRTPLEEIRRARVAHAKRLLTETDLTLPEVARRSGFIRHQRLTNVLKADCGLTPTQFRAKFCAPG